MGPICVCRPPGCDDEALAAAWALEGRIGKAHGGPSRSLDFLLGWIEPRAAIALHPIATSGCETPQSAASLGHTPPGYS